MIAVLADNHLRQQTRSCDPPLLQPIGQRGDERRQLGGMAPNEAAPNQPPPKKTGRFCATRIYGCASAASNTFRILSKA